ncbi:MAG TPA: hypothetical protein VFI29_20715 [Hanamia sp.]|nr:hypothetical protein [Hanamia sp.]
MTLKVFIYKFEFFSGFYESYFYKQIKAKDERDAIIQIVSFFTDKDEETTIRNLNKYIRRNWTVKGFWKSDDLRFENNDGTVGYDLIWIKEVPFDLDLPEFYI